MSGFTLTNQVNFVSTKKGTQRKNIFETSIFERVGATRYVSVIRRHMSNFTPQLFDCR